MRSVRLMINFSHSVWKKHAHRTILYKVIIFYFPSPREDIRTVYDIQNIRFTAQRDWNKNKKLPTNRPVTTGRRSNSLIFDENNIYVYIFFFNFPSVETGTNKYENNKNEPFPEAFWRWQRNTIGKTKKKKNLLY